MEKTQRNNIMLAFFTLLAVIVIVSIIGFFTLGKDPEIIQGQAEATEYRVSSKVPGRILKFFVSEGDKVKAGDTLAILEAPDVVAKLSQAQAAEQAAQALNEKALRGTRSEQLQAAYEMWQKAKAGLEIAEKSYNRVNRLYEEGVMTAQKRDEAKAQYDAMKATERAANAQYTMAKNGAQREDKAMAAAQVERAKGAVAEVSSYVSETYLVAVADGEVAEIFPKVGELVDRKRRLADKDKVACQASDIGSLASYLVFVRQAALPINQFTYFRENFSYFSIGYSHQVSFRYVRRNFGYSSFRTFYLCSSHGLVFTLCTILGHCVLCIGGTFGRLHGIVLRFCFISFLCGHHPFFV